MSDTNNPIIEINSAPTQKTVNPEPTVPVPTDKKLDMNVLTHTSVHTDISPLPVQQPANQQLTSRTGQNPPAKPTSLFECSLENIGLLSGLEIKKLLYDAHKNGTLEEAFIKLKGTDNGIKILYGLYKFLSQEWECTTQTECLRLALKHKLVQQIFGDDSKNMAMEVNKAISSVPKVGWFFRLRMVWVRVANVFATYCLTPNGKVNIVNVCKLRAIFDTKTSICAKMFPEIPCVVLVQHCVVATTMHLLSLETGLRNL
jgi:hypothetical protein